MLKVVNLVLIVLIIVVLKILIWLLNAVDKHGRRIAQEAIA
jgi:hypothetical protein